MVKFRNHLKSIGIDHWRDKYLDYEYLKSLLENEYQNAPPTPIDDTHINLMTINKSGGIGYGLHNRRSKLQQQYQSSPPSTKLRINGDDSDSIESIAGVTPFTAPPTPSASVKTPRKYHPQSKNNKSTNTTSSGYSDNSDSDEDEIELKVLNQLNQSMISNKSSTNMSPPLNSSQHLIHHRVISSNSRSSSTGGLNVMHQNNNQNLPLNDSESDGAALSKTYMIESPRLDAEEIDHHSSSSEENDDDDGVKKSKNTNGTKSPLPLVKTPLLKSSSSSSSLNSPHRHHYSSKQKMKQQQQQQQQQQELEQEQAQSNHLHLPQVKEMVPLSLEETAFSKEPSPVHLSPVLQSSSPSPLPPTGQNNIRQQTQSPLPPQRPLTPSSTHHSISITEIPLSRSFVPIEELVRGSNNGIHANNNSNNNNPITGISGINGTTTLIHEPTFQEEFIYQLDKIDMFYLERFQKIKLKIIDLCNMIQFIKTQSDKKVRNSRNISFIKEGMQDNYRVLTMLSSFRSINREGFEKLLEKFKKCNLILSNSLKMELMSKPFFDGEEATKLTHQINYIYARYFTGNDKKLAKNELRKAVPGDNRGLVFTVGLLIGFCIILGGLSIYTYAQYYPHDHPPYNAPLAWLLFRITLLPVLLGTLFAFQTFIYERAKINYVFIFQLKPEYSRSSLLYFKFGLIFISFWLLCLYFYIDTTSSSTSTLSNLIISPIIFPILFMITSVVVITLPFPVFAHKTRFWALKTFGRVLCAPWVRVHFKDFFMSVQLLSLGDFFFNIQSMICIFNYNELEPDELSFCRSTSFLALPIFNGLPYYFRIMQCFRRYYETRCFFPHITSAIRSIISLVTLVLAYLALLIKHDHKWNEIKTIWFFINIVGSLYKWYADMAVDWGFLLSPSTNKFWPLREKLVFSKYKFIYYIAMVLDLLLRYLWLLVFLIRDNTSHRLDNPLFLFFLSMGEVVWATQFIFFRVESEHCQTADKYSVYHDIPMPFTQEYKQYMESKKSNTSFTTTTSYSTNSHNNSSTTSLLDGVPNTTTNDNTNSDNDNGKGNN